VSLLIVTPVYNERENIFALADQLNRSSLRPDLWCVVDDGSTDGAVDELAERFAPGFPVRFLKKVNDGGLIGGSAFRSWFFGVDRLAGEGRTFDLYMKLDADVELPRDYLSNVVSGFANPSVGLVGGSLSSRRDREQNLHVPGPVKLYSAPALSALRDLPQAVGFDVMDEVAIKAAGLRVIVLPEPFGIRRAIGASQGRLHGRRRNGQVCRWTGYSCPYFVLHVLRYLLRSPYLIGSLAMIWGYVTAGSGPYPSNLKKAHGCEQRTKLTQLRRQPVAWIRQVYGAPVHGREVDRSSSGE
jgi:dolichol-phosphate mannosyltransferase